jgi:hypothetical protein
VILLSPEEIKDRILKGDFKASATIAALALAGVLF